MIYPPTLPKCHRGAYVCMWEGCVCECARMWFAMYLGVCQWLCDILALHLVQVVLSPQSPLETPEDRERGALIFSSTQTTTVYLRHPINLKSPVAL